MRWPNFDLLNPESTWIDHITQVLHLSKKTNICMGESYGYDFLIFQTPFAYDACGF